MIILTCITLIIAMVGLVLILYVPSNRRISWLYTISGLIVFCLGFAIVDFVIEESIRQDTISASKIATINTNINIYQDNDSGEYFRLIADNWNILDMYNRVYIDKEDAEKIIEVAEITAKWG